MHGEIRELGATLAALSPQLPERSLEQTEARRLDFDILYDADNDYARQLGLVFAFPDDLRDVYANFGLDLPKFHASEKWELPMPARFVVATDGSVRYAESDPDYTRRPEPEETLAALRALAG